MDQLKRYLDKNNIEYCSNWYGDSYFDYKFSIPVVHVELPYINNGLDEKLRKYCKRYGYKLRYNMAYDHISYTIAKEDDYKLYNAYMNIRDKCIHTWEYLRHYEGIYAANAKIQAYFDSYKKEAYTLLGISL